MENYIGKICPFCKTEIKEGETVKVCPSCGIPHHEGCWEENKGCTTFGCTEQYHKDGETNPAYVCHNCGAQLRDGQMFCTKCGTAKNSTGGGICGKCGAKLQSGQEFCSMCGQKVGLAVDAGVNSAINQFNAGIQKTNNKNKKTPLMIGITAAAVAIVVIMVVVISGGDPEVDFQKLYDEYCQFMWADVGSDGSYLRIDTNPYDQEDDGLAYPSAYTAIKEVNKALDLPDSLINEMGETTGSDGKQSETFDNIIVTWKYHPDKGLEVTYKKAR